MASRGSSRQVAARTYSNARSNGQGAKGTAPTDFQITDFEQSLTSVLSDPKPGAMRVIKEDLAAKWGEAFINAEVHPNPQFKPISYVDFSSYLNKITGAMSGNRQEADLQTVIENAKRKSAAVMEEANLELFYDKDFQLEKDGTFANLFALDESHGVEVETDGSLKRIEYATHTKERGLLPFESKKDEGEALKAAANTIETQLLQSLDSLEKELSKKITSRSDQFIGALHNQQELNEILNNAMRGLVSLRRDLASIHNSACSQPMKLVGYLKRRRNLLKLLEMIVRMQDIQKTQPEAHKLLNEKEYAQALELIDDTLTRLKDGLNKLHAFRYYGSQLEEIRRAVIAVVNSDMENMLSAKFRRIMSLLDADDDQPQEEGNEDAEDETIASCFIAMIKAGNYDGFKQFTEFATLYCDDLIARLFQSYGLGGEYAGRYTKSSSHLGQQAQKLPLTRWIKLFKAVATRGIALMKATQLLFDHLEGIQESLRQGLHGEDEHLQPVEDGAEPAVLDEKLKGGLSGSQTLLHKHFEATVLNVHYLWESNIRNLDEYGLKDLRSLCAEYRETELKAVFTKIESTLTEPAKQIVIRQHAQDKKIIAEILEAEPWKDEGVPVSMQQVFDNIVAYDTGKNGDNGKVSGPEKSEYLLLDGRKYRAIGAVMHFAKICRKSLDQMERYPNLVYEIARRQIELFQLFNERTMELIVGAGVLKVNQNIKNILARHLCLAHSAVEIAVVLLDKVAQHAKKVMPAAKAPSFDAEYKRTKDDMERHETEIKTKFRMMMNNELTRALPKDGTLQSKVEGAASPHVVTIVSKTTRLYSVLRHHLQSDDLEQLFDGILAILDEQLKRFYEKQNLKDAEILAVFAKDLEYYDENLRKMEPDRTLHPANALQALYKSIRT
eukprot:Clim_evm4s155 gene=Clim_evmTU4s155